MILPRRDTAAGPATPTFTHGAPTPSLAFSEPGIDPENWSSLIGIITAIVGNIMISFALNMQRYAHIRLEREWQEKERQRKRRSASYGASRAKLADERSQANLARKYHPPRHADCDVDQERGSMDDSTESDPLLPASPSQSNAHAESRPSLERDESTGEEVAYKQGSYLKSPYWWAGIILMTTGEAGNFLAYGFAPASIVSPLGVVALISNCIIAPIMLKEPFRKRDGLGVLVAVGGAVTVVLSANDNNPKLGPDEIWELITTWEFETYFGITVALIIALIGASNKFGEKSILIDLGLVGLFGGYTALSTKGVASMLSYTLWHALTFPVTYLLVAILVGTAIMQIKYVNRALQRFDATQVIPVQFVLFTLSVILGSAVLYRDFERTSGGDAGKFIGGCALTFLGVWMITSGRTRNKYEDDEDREPEPEDAINLVGERYRDQVDDVPNEGATESSRRSSTIRAMSPPIAIHTRPPTFDASGPTTPGSIPELPEPPQTPPANPTPSVPSSLIMNPWESEAVSPLSSRTQPTLSRHTTLSTPLLPSEGLNAPLISTSSPDTATNPPPPRTPTRGISDNQVPITPGTGGTLAPRLRRMGTAERVVGRNSIPGPLLASPLSNSLSAMVADLKRGGSVRSALTYRDNDAANGSGSGGVRRRESVLGIGASEVDGTRDIGEPLDRRRTTTDQLPLAANASAGEERERPALGARGRSLSGTLNELWRGFRGGNGEELGGPLLPRQEDGVGEGSEEQRS